MTGSNMYGSLGIGTEDSIDFGEQVFRLEQFHQKRVYEIAVGDFHTLVLASGCNCVDPVDNNCAGQFKCEGGCNLYCYGFNIHGQCDGMNTEQQILSPKIVPFFYVNEIQVSKIAARRSRSIAISRDDEVYEWGFVGSDLEGADHEQFRKLCQLPGKCKQVEIGLEFNLFLMDGGALYIYGAITQEGMNVINTWDKLLNLSDRMTEKSGLSVNFKNVQCGYSHAILTDEEDKVYSMGAGIYGQLGTEVDYDTASYPVPVTDVNDGMDKILMISCGAHFSICYSELGILYYWGMLIPEEIESIQRLPCFLAISLPLDITELELLSFKLVDIKASFREILACDSQGRTYHCELSVTQTLKPYKDIVQNVIGHCHQTLIGRAQHLFFQNQFDPESCIFIECQDVMQTIEENLATIKLCNKKGLDTFLDPAGFKTPEKLHKKFPVNIIMNGSPDKIQDTHEGGYDFKEINKFIDKETGLNVISQGTFNQLLFKQTYEIDECDHSQFELKIYPQKEIQEIYIHVLIGNTEIKDSPKKVKIVKSDKQKEMEDAAKVAKLAKLEILRKKEADKLNKQKLKEEHLNKRREDTKSRADEALKKAKIAAEAEKAQKEIDRKLRKENRTGGGFKLTPLKKK